MRKLAVAALALTPALTTVAPAAAATNVIHLRAQGCRNCLVWVGGINPDDEYDGVNKMVQLRHGQADALIPSRFTSLQFGIQTKKGWTGGGGQAIIVPQYRTYYPGEPISNQMSRYSQQAKICFANTAASADLSFIVKRDPGDKRPRPSKKKHPGQWAYWTPFILRAWASPTVTGVGQWVSVRNGQASAQNTVCGLSDMQD